MNKKNILLGAMLVLLILFCSLYIYEKYQDNLNSKLQKQCELCIWDFVAVQTRASSCSFISNHTGNWTLESLTYDKLCGGKK